MTNNDSQMNRNPEKKKAVIFIIDDNPANLRILDDLLKQSGFKVLIARSGKSGIEKIKNVLPDLILLDILMPGMDGFETCRCLKSYPPTKDIPIIFMTALADTANKIKGLSLGAVDYITKPFQQEEVLARIELQINLRNLSKKLAEQNRQLQAEIAERRRIEEHLKVLSLASEQSPASIVITNPLGEIEYVNSKFESVTGYSLAEVKGKNPRILKSGYTKDQEYRQMWATISAGKDWYGEFHNRRKNGELYWELASISPIQDETGKITHYVAVKEDITKRKETEERLRQSEEKFRTIFDHASDAISIHDLQGNFLEVNWVICQRLGYSRAELLTMNVKDIDAPEYAELLPLRLSQIQANRHLIFETAHLAKDGRKIPIEVNASLIEFEHKIVIMSVSRDITQRKQIEEQLQAERNFSTAVLQTIGALVIVLDAEGHIVRFNRACEELSGYTFAEVKNKVPWEFLLLEEESWPVQVAFEDLKLGNFPNCFENYWVAKDGSLLLIEWHNTALTDSQGKVEYVIGTGIDITERKAIEAEIRQLNATLERRVEQRTEELRRSEARFRQYFEQSLIGIAITACETNRNQRDFPRKSPEEEYQKIVEVNDRLCEILGYSKQELTQMKLSQVTHPDDLKIALSYIQRVLKGEIDGYSLDKRFIRQDGTVIYASISSKCLRLPSGKVDYFVTLVQDITGRKEAEYKLQQANEQLQITNRELARATRLKDEFLANMSHELRTPLNAILGMSEGLLEEVYGSLNKQQKKSLQIIEKSGKHLLELINEILDLSKIESGKLELQIAPCHIRSLCTSSLTFVKQQALKKQIKLITSIEEDPEVIDLDERRMRQVLINLLTNAVKFTPQGGKVTLQVQFTSEPPNVIFSVIDTGIGIAQEDLGKLFQAFTQLDSGLNRSQEGTGLGLALVKRIAELHGGSVTVESQLNQGSCFQVTIPYKPRILSNREDTITENINPIQEPESSPNPDNFVLSASRLHRLILLAEDNQGTIDTMSDYLESKGYQLITAHNGQEALNLALAHKPHIILMDISMPQMDGLTAIKKIRLNPDFAQTPIIALTALAMERDRQKCLEAGANEYLTKPVSLKQLVNTIEQLLAVKSQGKGECP